MLALPAAAVLLEVASWMYAMHSRTSWLEKTFGKRYADLSPQEQQATDRAMAYHYRTTGW